ncbi:hypothetical protein [Roseovarius spongiae]|nr:hypothetical protein [Roseovarius spongiae]
MNSDDKLSTGEVFGAITLGALIAAPYVLLFTLIGLFFRAPLAALIGTAFIALLGLVGWQMTLVAAQDAHPLAAVAIACGAMLAGLFACLPLSRLVPAFFNWECATIRLMLTRGGAVGRVGYMIAQLLPGIVLVVLGVAMLSDLDEVGKTLFTESGSANLNFYLWILIFGWLTLSQIAVLRFHRALHPVGSAVTFAGHPLATVQPAQMDERDAA